MTDREVMIEVVKMLAGLGLTIEQVDSATKRILVSIPEPKP